MKVKMLCSQAGPGINRRPKEVIEVDAKEGKRLIETGQAEPLRGVIPSKVETAMVDNSAARTAPAKQPKKSASKKKAKGK